MSREYVSGRTLAEKWFNHYLETGICSPGGAKSQIYCETVAGVIRNNEPITENTLEAITTVKKEKNNLFYDGVCDFLLEKMKESS